jgi:hypothetical protein
MRMAAAAEVPCYSAHHSVKPTSDGEVNWEPQHKLCQHQGPSVELFLAQVSRLTAPTSAHLKLTSPPPYVLIMPPLHRPPCRYNQAPRVQEWEEYMRTMQVSGGVRKEEEAA